MLSLFYNGFIHSLEKKQKKCDALLVQGDRIIFVGEKDDINLPAYKLNSIDLKSCHVFPGFIDCHTHIAAVALANDRIKLDNCTSLEDAVKNIENHSNRFTSSEWILGSGWNANLWLDGSPHRDYLDRIFPNNPVALYSKDGHAQWLNSKALQICGFTQLSKDPPGGKLGRDDNGDLTGIVYEKCCLMVDEKAEQISFDALYRGMQILYPKLHALGITSVHSCESLDHFKLFQQLQLNNKLDLRICMHPPGDKLDILKDAGLHSSWGNDWLRLGGLKYFVDGSLGSQTAEMFENFTGLDHAGVEVISEDALCEYLCRAASSGWGATVHAIGDKANFKALNAIEKAQFVHSPIPIRYRIEHAQILRPNDIPRFKKMNIIASMQPLHIADDIKIADLYLGKRSIYAYPINSLMKAGICVVFGSDMPIADPDPLKGINAAVSRQYQLNKSEPAWNEQECISSEQALLAYTRDAAYSSYEESFKGTIGIGKLADLIVLNSDITKANISQLSETRVEMTILDGKIVFNRENPATIS